MEPLDETFGLTIATGSSGPARLWADFVRTLVVPDAQANDAEAIAARFSAADPTTTQLLSTVLGELANPADVTSVAASNVMVALGASRLAPVMARLEVPERKWAVQNAARSLSPSAVVTVVEATGQTFSLPLSITLRGLLHKLAHQADTLTDGARAIADQAFRDLASHIVERWAETQVNAGAFAFSDMFGEQTRVKSSIAPEAERVVALSLETGAVGPVVWASIKEQSRTEQGVRYLISMVSNAPEGRARELITETLASPGRVISLLREDPIDFEAVDMMIAHLGGNAIKPLLDELVEAQNRGTRRAIMDRLIKMGSEIGPFVQDRLSDHRWYVVRNMISLLRESGYRVDPLVLDKFMNHDDARVRREVLQLRLDDPVLRGDSFAAAFMDKDKAVVRTALQAARTDFPVSAVAALAKRVLDADFPAEYRVMSLYLLGKSGQVSALDALVAYASGGKSLLGKIKLANKSPEMLAALSGLARSWPSERSARELLEIAWKSKDDQVLNALNAVSGNENG